MLVTRRINRFWSRVKGFIKFWSGHNLNPKNHTRKINKFSNDFSIISSLRTYIHTYIFFENISIPPNHILLTPTKNIFITFVHFSHHLAHILLSANLYFVLVKIGSILFLSSPDMHQSHHLAGRCHVTGINSLLTSFLNALRCVYMI